MEKNQIKVTVILFKHGTDYFPPHQFINSNVNVFKRPVVVESHTKMLYIFICCYFRNTENRKK